MIIAATPTKKMSGNVDLLVESQPVMLALKISLPAIGNSIATAIITTTIPIAVAVSDPPDAPLLTRANLPFILALEISKISRSHDWLVGICISRSC